MGAPLNVAPGPRSTRQIEDVLDGTVMSTAARARLYAPFPVAGPASYTDDFGEPRTFPEPHSHKGVDIVAGLGTPIVSSGSGTVAFGANEVGGTFLTVSVPQSDCYFYAHLDRYADGLASGDAVHRGDIIGYVGATGDATGPHLHFEIHPRCGEAVDPTPYLDRWLSQARQTARALGFDPLSAMLPAPNDGGGERSPLHAAVPSMAAAATQLMWNASTSHGLGGAASLPLAGVLFAAVLWLELRRRQRRLYASLLASSPSNAAVFGIHSTDPLWSATATVPSFGGSPSPRASLHEQQGGHGNGRQLSSETTRPGLAMHSRRDHEGGVAVKNATNSPLPVRANPERTADRQPERLVTNP